MKDQYQVIELKEFNKKSLYEIAKEVIDRFYEAFVSSVVKENNITQMHIHAFISRLF